MTLETRIAIAIAKADGATDKMVENIKELIIELEKEKQK